MSDPCNPTDPTDPSATFTLDESRAVPTAVVRAVDVPMSELSTLFDAAFSALPAELAMAGAAPAGAALAVYSRFSDDWSRCDLEVGFPLHEPLPGTLTVEVGDGGTIDIEPSELPAGRVVSALHEGPYDELSMSWKRLTDALIAAGHTPAMPCWEVYLTEPGPGANPADLRTGLNTLVE